MDRLLEEWRLRRRCERYLSGDTTDADLATVLAKLFVQRPKPSQRGRFIAQLVDTHIAIAGCKDIVAIRRVGQLVGASADAVKKAHQRYGDSDRKAEIWGRMIQAGFAVAELYDEEWLDLNDITRLFSGKGAVEYLAEGGEHYRWSQEISDNVREFLQTTYEIDLVDSLGNYQN